MVNKVYIQVDTREKVSQLAKYIQDHELLAFDIESNSLNVRKGAIIGFSVSANIGEGYYIPTMEFTDGELKDLSIEGVSCHKIASKLLDMLVGKKLIMHNGSFDSRFVKNFYGVDLISSIYCDTMLLVHTVMEEGAGLAGGFQLKAIAIMVQDKIGLDVEKEANEEQIELKESVKKNGGSTTKENFEIYKADLPVLSKYACADTDLTLRIYYHFLEILKEEGLESFFFEDEVMPLYREVTIPMEEKGVRLDLDLMNKTRQEVSEVMEQMSAKVVEALLDKEMVRAWILERAMEKYPASNKGSFAQELALKYNLELPVSEKTGKLSISGPNLKKLPDSNVKNYLLTNDPLLLDPKDSMDIALKLWKKEYDGQFFNIQSKDQLGKIAFEALGIQPLSTTEKGKPQFDEDLIQSISEKHEWAKYLRIYNKLMKIRSTYIDRLLEGQEDGIYYFQYKQHATISGRYGSDAQQLPKPIEEGEDDPIIIEYTNRVRAFIISKPGHVFIDNDYESLEPHVFAHVSGDEGLKDIFRNGWDFYSTVAIKTEKLHQYSPDKKAENFLKKHAPTLRQKAKGYSLGIPYGMGAYALGKNIGVSTKEAQELIDGYFAGFPELKKWFDASRQQAKEQGYVKTQVGRIRHLKKVNHIYETIGDAILDKQMRDELAEVYGMERVLSIQRDYVNGLNNSCNFQIQSLSASIVNRAAIQINRRLKAAGIVGWVCAQIHDQLVTEIVEDERVNEAMEIVKDCMENTTKISLQLKAPPALAHNWRDGH
jgi:DNA polymerase I-like protein with 3'-5' exonuclease and polymerase domains